MDQRHQKKRADARKSCDLRSNNFRETGPVLGKEAQNLCVSTQSYFSQTYRFRTTGPKQIRIEHCGGTLIGLVSGNEQPTIAELWNCDVCALRHDLSKDSH